jgi:hypothetical protein
VPTGVLTLETPQAAKRTLLVNHGTRIYAHHLEQVTDHDFSQIRAEAHTDAEGRLSLRNHSSHAWLLHTDGSMLVVPPGISVQLHDRLSLTMGTVRATAQVRMGDLPSHSTGLRTAAPSLTQTGYSSAPSAPVNTSLELTQSHRRRTALWSAPSCVS